MSCDRRSIISIGLTWTLTYLLSRYAILRGFRLERRALSNHAIHLSLHLSLTDASEQTLLFSRRPGDGKR